MHPGDRAGQGFNDWKISALVRFLVSFPDRAEETFIAWLLISAHIYGSHDK